MEKRDLIPAIIWISLGIGIVADSYHLGLGSLHKPGPGLLPFLLGIGLTLVSLPLFYRFLRSRTGITKERGKGIWSGVQFRKMGIVLFSLIGYALLLEVIGYIFATCGILMVLFKTLSTQKWYWMVILPILTAVGTYFLFGIVLEVPLPPGFWGRR